MTSTPRMVFVVFYAAVVILVVVLFWFLRVVWKYISGERWGR